MNHLQVQREQPLGLMGFNICHARLRGSISSFSQFVSSLPPATEKRCDRKDSSPQRTSVGEVRFLFNGDFVDRGTWGPEAPGEFRGTFGWKV